MKKRKKRAVTLIEIMIVILLIGLIGGALAFNMRGSMDKGKVFKSNQNAERVYNALMMASATGEFNIPADCTNKEKIAKIVTNSALAKEGKAVLKDGWGQELKIEPSDNNNDIAVYSALARNWEQTHGAK